MTSASDMFRHRERKKFTHGGKEYPYDVYDAFEPPSNAFGRVGDIADGGNLVWFRGKSSWEVSSREVDHIGRPIQKHPLLKSDRRLDGLEWRAQTTWNKRKRKAEPSNDSNSISHEDQVPEPCATSSRSLLSPNFSNFSPQNPENSWILDLWRLWDSYPIINITPVKSTGFDILKELILLPNPLPKSPLDESNAILIKNRSALGTPPTLGHVIRDIIHPENHNVFDFVNQYGDPDIEYPEFILSMMRSTEGHAWDDRRRLYGALDIKASESGIGSCHLDAFPYNLHQEVLVSEDGWASTWTPPGAISHTHMDFYGSTQYFIHFYGKKLWLLWPPSDYNLEWFSSQHKQRANGNRILESIRRLEGLQLLYIDNSEETFVLKPNTLHACISFSSSAHTGVQIWGLNHCDESFRIIAWAISWIKKGFYGSLGQSRCEILNEIDVIEDELERWSILAKKISNNPLTASLKEKIMASRESLCELRSTVSTSPPKPGRKSKRGAKKKRV